MILSGLDHVPTTLTNKAVYWRKEQALKRKLKEVSNTIATASSLFSCDSPSDDTDDRDAVATEEKLCRRDDDWNKVVSSSKSLTCVKVCRITEEAQRYNASG